MWASQVCECTNPIYSPSPGFIYVECLFFGDHNLLILCIPVVQLQVIEQASIIRAAPFLSERKIPKDSEPGSIIIINLFWCPDSSKIETDTTNCTVNLICIII